jgi:hypothetical protein
MYASLLGTSGALHLDVFDQPAKKLPERFLMPSAFFRGFSSLGTLA